jgi:hypothetical protein
MMADVTLACGTQSIGLSEDPPYMARCDTLARVSHRASAGKPEDLSVQVVGLAWLAPPTVCALGPTVNGRVGTHRAPRVDSWRRVDSRGHESQQLTYGMLQDG